MNTTDLSRDELDVLHLVRLGARVSAGVSFARRLLDRGLVSEQSGWLVMDDEQERAATEVLEREQRRREVLG